MDEDRPDHDRRLPGFCWMLLLETKADARPGETDALFEGFRDQVALVGGACTATGGPFEWLCVVRHPDGSLTNSEALRLLAWLEAQPAFAHARFGPQEDSAAVGNTNRG